MRQHFACKKVDVLAAECRRHRAEVKQRHQMTDAEALHGFDKLIAYRSRTADNNEAAFDEILKTHVTQIEIAGRVGDGLFKSIVFEAAWDRLVMRRRM